MVAAAPQTATADRRRTDLAEVLNRYGDDFLRQRYLRPAQLKAVQAIRSCRTPARGGHCQWCSRCGFVRYAYHSCRNRHCPKCQTFAKEQWLQLRRRELLPVNYFHNVFTLPHELNPLILLSEDNQRKLLGLLFRATAETLLTFGRNNLGGQVGFTLLLHTWDQQLKAHFHLHALIAGGALSAESDQWVSSGPRFLFPVRALSKVFRAKFMEAFAALCRRGELHIPLQLKQLATPAGLNHWCRRLNKQPWVVYSKAPCAGADKLLDYLGRYTHRVAISDHRLLSAEGGQVRFHYRDRAAGNLRKIASLPPDKFIGRFLQHVLPARFMRIRHYGFLANRAKKQALARCRQQLQVEEPQPQELPQTVAEWILQLTGLDIHRCPRCQTPLQTVEFAPGDALPSLQLLATTVQSHSYFDTS